MFLTKIPNKLGKQFCLNWNASGKCKVDDCIV